MPSDMDATPNWAGEPDVEPTCVPKKHDHQTDPSSGEPGSPSEDNVSSSLQNGKRKMTSLNTTPTLEPVSKAPTPNPYSSPRRTLPLDSVHSGNRAAFTSISPLHKSPILSPVTPSPTTAYVLVRHCRNRRGRLRDSDEKLCGCLDARYKSLHCPHGCGHPLQIGDCLTLRHGNWGHTECPPIKAPLTREQIDLMERNKKRASIIKEEIRALRALPSYEFDNFDDDLGELNLFSMEGSKSSHDQKLEGSAANSDVATTDQAANIPNAKQDLTARFNDCHSIPESRIYPSEEAPVATPSFQKSGNHKSDNLKSAPSEIDMDESSPLKGSTNLDAPPDPIRSASEVGLPERVGSEDTGATIVKHSEYTQDTVSDGEINLKCGQKESSQDEDNSSESLNTSSTTSAEDGNVDKSVTSSCEVTTNVSKPSVKGSQGGNEKILKLEKCLPFYVHK